MAVSFVLGYHCPYIEFSNDTKDSVISGSEIWVDNAAYVGSKRLISKGWTLAGLVALSRITCHARGRRDFLRPRDRYTPACLVAFQTVRVFPHDNFTPSASSCWRADAGTTYSVTTPCADYSEEVSALAKPHRIVVSSVCASELFTSRVNPVRYTEIVFAHIATMRGDDSQARVG